MVTSKPKIQAYIAPHLADRLEAYRLEENLSQSQAIEAVIASFFSEQPVNNGFKELQIQITALAERVQQLEAGVAP